MANVKNAAVRSVACTRRISPRHKAQCKSQGSQIKRSRLSGSNLAHNGQLTRSCRPLLLLWTDTAHHGHREKIIITDGFGPFGEHTVNASWVAVQELKKLGFGNDVNLHVCEVPVEYQAVQSLVPSLWNQYHPQLVVHVGVSAVASVITLEKCGHNHGYQGRDNCNFHPDSQCCVEGGPDYIDSAIDMDHVCKRVTTSGLGVSVSVSEDAGRYLCDYIYYTSLYLSQGRSAFVHVPPLGKPYSGEDLGQALQAIIKEMLDLLAQTEDKIHGH